MPKDTTCSVRAKIEVSNEAMEEAKLARERVIATGKAYTEAKAQQEKSLKKAEGLKKEAE